MKTLVAPLNWGLGHASRCVALVRRLLAAGDEVVIGGDGESLVLLRQHFPELRYVELAPLSLRYSSGKSQVWALTRSIPKVIRWTIADHRRLREIQAVEHFDRIVSDNRFGLWVENNDNENDNGRDVVTVYMTHQVHICLPKGWQWAEGIASRIHARIYNKYKELWIPDYEDEERSLAGRLSHEWPGGGVGDRKQAVGNREQTSGCKVRYIGPLSRFESLDLGEMADGEPMYDVVAVLSGLEPQRTMLEEQIRRRYYESESEEPRVLIVRGKVMEEKPLSDEELAGAMMGAKTIIARSGYSTIMDLACLGLMDRAELIPTPGQSEQEYLYSKINN